MNLFRVNHEMYYFQETIKPLTSEIEATPPLAMQSPATPFSTSSIGCWSIDDIPSSPEENTGLAASEEPLPNSQTDIDVLDSNLAYYWRSKYPDLKGGSMTRELSEVELANLNQELSEAVASF